MRKFTFEELEDQESQAEIWREDEKERLWLEAMAKESRSATENQ